MATFHDSCPVNFIGQGASIFVLEDEPYEVANAPYRGILEVHLFLHAPSLEEYPLVGIDGSSRESLQ